LIAIGAGRGAEIAPRDLERALFHAADEAFPHAPFTCGSSTAIMRARERPFFHHKDAKPSKLHEDFAVLRVLRVFVVKS